MKNVTRIITTVALVGGMVFTQSCQKSKLNNDTTSSEDNSTAETLWDDVMTVVEETAKEEDLEGKTSGVNEILGSCATVTVDPAGANFPKTVTVDFGTTNCTGNAGVERRGIVEFVITDYYRNEGCKITTTTDNYYVNDYKVEGTKIVENKGENSNGNLNYDISADGEITTPNDEKIEWHSKRNREWVEGQETTFWTDGLNGILDDVYHITGEANGIDRNGRAYEIEITKALEVQVGCRWVKEGILELTPDELKTRVVDFGDGNCDNDATVTIGKKTWDIKMK